MNINADLHIHSKFSAATSSSMDLQTLARESRKKGIDLIGTGDCLHKKWLGEIKKLKTIEEGTFLIEQTHFILTAEVEDSSRVHHLLIVPSISKAEELREKFAKYSTDIDLQGRPRINLSACEIAEISRDARVLLGPCHAFTPWTSMYAYFKSLKECYRELSGYISFIELGLSADSDYADRIEELQNLTFLTNSDAHSPYPLRLAREFNRFKVEEISFKEIESAILRKNGRKAILNIGIPPEEGKYNESACVRCYRHYTMIDSMAKKWRCTCGGTIKKGVRDRVNELADFDKPHHPEHRPPYLRLIPLTEIIAMAFSSTPNTRNVQEEWASLVSKFGSEVVVMLDTEISSIAEIADQRVVEVIKAFREQRIIIHPGGGGNYGTIELPETFSEKKPEPKKEVIPPSRAIQIQRSLLDFE